MPVELVVLDNPVLQELLSVLRCASTDPPRFREALEMVGLLMGYEVARELPVEEYAVKTPLGEARAFRPKSEEAVIIAVLRAAIPLAYGMLRVLRRASVGFVAARRLEDTMRREGGRMVFDVEISYESVPSVEGKVVVIVDPMLATASTISRVARKVLEGRPKKLVVAALIAARPGVERLEEEVGEARVKLYVLAVDPVLNDKGFIVPGLGDAGDRAFATAPSKSPPPNV